ncbi:MAG TPA: M28 family metallopeptidase [Candidatus Limnocylindrales bacterium]|nr:M28 family metallopeptidase [Candidatus Limnocylindrales bacterium]
MTRRRIALASASAVVVAVAALLAATAPALAPAPERTPATASPTPSPAAGPPEVDADRALAHVRYLADPERGGRWSGSAGYDEAAEYVAERFREIGLEPLGDGGTFFQRFRMPIVDLAATPVLERLAPEPRAFAHRVEFTERVGGYSGSGTVEGRLVFAASGTPEDWSAIDAEGAIVILLGPFERDPLEAAVSAGAAATISVSDRILKYSYIPRFEARTLPAIIATEAAVDALLSTAGRTVRGLAAAIELRRSGPRPGAAPLAFDTGATVRLSVPLTPPREIDARNVVGLLRAGGPESARAVLVGGHLDGVGTDPDGAVFPAANDNASGVALTIEIARVLAEWRSELRHSIVFVAFAGEEQGLWGSEAYAVGIATSPGRTESLLAYVNLDVVGCCGPTLGASEESAALHRRLRAVAERYGLDLARLRGSSDQATFARRGVDAAILAWADTGPVHTTADVPELVTAGSLATVGRLAGSVVLEIARGE